MKYNLVLVVSPGEDPKKAEDRVKTILDKEGFQVTKLEAWGKKPLAYPIRKQNEGLYFALVVEAEKTQPKKLHARLKLEEFILRSLILSANENFLVVKQLKTVGGAQTVAPAKLKA